MDAIKNNWLITDSAAYNLEGLTYYESIQSINGVKLYLYYGSLNKEVIVKTKTPDVSHTLLKRHFRAESS